MIVIYSILFVSLYVSIFFFYNYFLNKGKMYTKVDSNFAPQVTILIPAYNEEMRIGKTLDAVFSMDYPQDKLKVIVVNDGSTDGTVNVVKQYNVKLYNKKNEGCKAYPVNYGLKRIKGEFVFVLDADCIPAKDCLRKLVQYFKDEKTMAAIPQIRMLKPRNFWARLQAIEMATSAFIRKNLFFINVLNITPGAVLFRRKFFDEHGYYDVNSIGEDLEMGMRVKAAGYNIAQAIDSYVSTYPHHKFKNLFRERLRWYYGYFTTMKKYKFMFGKGELGLFYLPLTMIFILLPPVMLIRAVILAAQTGSLGGGMLHGVSYDFTYSIFKHNFTIPFRLLYYLIAMVIIISLLSFLLARFYTRLRVKYIFVFPIYITAYMLILGLFMGMALVYFIAGKKPGW